MTGGLRRWAAVAALVLVALAAAWLGRDAWSRRAAEDAGAEAVRAARDAIPALLTYQAATAGKDLPAAARDRLTGKFRDDYTQLIATVVVPEAVRKGISATATVPAAAVVSADSRHAVVLAYVDQVTTVGTEAPVQNNTSARVSMDNVDGRWLISGLDPI